MDTLEVPGRSASHRRGGSVATTSTQVDSDDATSNANSSFVSRLKAKTRRRKGSDSSNPPEAKAEQQERERAAALDPEKDTTDPSPFHEKPSRLAMLVDPKSLETLEKIGGVQGLLNGLGVDPGQGLLAGAEEAKGVEEGAPRSSAEMEVRADGPQWKVGLEERRRVYGRNDLPKRKTKGLLLLMWLAFKDKVLVSWLLEMWSDPDSSARSC